MESKSENEALSKELRQLLPSQTHQLPHPERDDTVTVVELAGGRSLTSIKSLLDEYRTVPERRKGTATLRDIESLIAHANRFKNDDSALFADPGPDRKSPILLSVLNYHPKVSREDKAGNRDHRGRYAFPLSEPWQAWTKEREPMTTAAFSEFLEERVEDIAEPASAKAAALLADKLGIRFAEPAVLMNVARGLSLKVEMHVTNAQNLQSGETQFQFEEKHTDKTGAPLKVPAAFLLNIPVFEGGDYYEIAVRLRYRVAGSRVVFFFQLFRADRVFDHAFETACKKAQADTGLPLFIGSPE